MRCSYDLHQSCVGVQGLRRWLPLTSRKGEGAGAVQVAAYFTHVDGRALDAARSVITSALHKAVCCLRPCYSSHSMWSLARHLLRQHQMMRVCVLTGLLWKRVPPWRACCRRKCRLRSWAAALALRPSRRRPLCASRLLPLAHAGPVGQAAPDLAPPSWPCTGRAPCHPSGAFTA